MLQEWSSASPDDAPPSGWFLSSPLTGKLHAKFCKFQIQAKHIQERVEVTQTPVDSGLAEDILQQYSCGVSDEIQQVRDRLRRGKWDIDDEVRADHDALCISLAVWELTHELVVSSAPSAARILHWYNRHYLEEEIAEWWQAAKQCVESSDALGADSPFWEPLCRLALSDCKAEVLSLLRRSADRHVAHVCEFLGRIPSLQQMEQAIVSKAEYQQAMLEIQAEARRLREDMPAGHPIRRLLSIYAGSSQAEFDAGKDVGSTEGRTWVEDLAYSHAWVFPEIRKTELADLLRAVAQRRTAENIDELDRVLFTIFALDVPAMLRQLASLPDRFPPFLITHLVDVLYFAGRVPLAVGSKDEKLVPPRDWHLMQYAKELCSGSRAQKRFAVDYLRAGGSQAIVAQLEEVAGEYCESAAEAEMDDAMSVLVDLDLAATIGVKQCRRHAEALRTQGDLAGSLRWACQAEQYASIARGYYVSELLDSFAEKEEDVATLLSILTPPSFDEPLERYPPESLLTLLAPSGAPLTLAPSGRLYFFVQYARCRALRRAGVPASSYAPMLVKLLTAGVVAPSLTQKLLVEELLPTLADETPPLSSEEVLLLMRHVQSLTSDPLRRVKLSVPMDDLHQAMGACLSRAILSHPSGAFSAVPLGAPMLAVR